MGWCFARLIAPLARSRMFHAALLFAFASQPGWAQAPPQIETTMNNMLAAIQAGSLADFIAAGNASFQAGMTKAMLDTVNVEFAPRLKQGYTSTFLGIVKQQGYTVYLWKLEFKDGKDDRVVTMAFKDGKVGGFFLR
ncbi:MAG: hypothetical protein E6H55_17415 [Betaproteobacteria bacterium]|nr:MAG: hypothetical protein E6H55_17415 [Betaproteobacteria bacterium]